MIEPKGFLIYPKRGITHALSTYGHKQYPTNSLDQNHLVLVFIEYPHKVKVIAFLLGFGMAMQYPFRIQ